MFLLWRLFFFLSFYVFLYLCLRFLSAVPPCKGSYILFCFYIFCSVISCSQSTYRFCLFCLLSFFLWQLTFMLPVFFVTGSQFQFSVSVLAREGGVGGGARSKLHVICISAVCSFKHPNQVVILITAKNASNDIPFLFPHQKLMFGHSPLHIQRLKFALGGSESHQQL